MKPLRHSPFTCYFYYCRMMYCLNFWSRICMITAGMIEIPTFMTSTIPRSQLIHCRRHWHYPLRIDIIRCYIDRVGAPGIKVSTNSIPSVSLPNPQLHLQFITSSPRPSSSSPPPQVVPPSPQAQQVLLDQPLPFHNHLVQFVSTPTTSFSD